MSGLIKDGAKRFERAGSRVLRALLCAVLPRPTPPAASLDPSAVRRVLIVRQDSRLGNLLFLTPLLKAIREAFPAAATDVLISDAYGEVFRHNPNVAGLLVLPKAMFWPDPSLPWRLLAAVRRSRYDLAIDASAAQSFSLSGALITALTGAPRTVGFDRGDARTFLNTLVPPPQGPLHITDNLLCLLRHAAPGAAAGAVAAQPEFFLSPAERAEGRALWTSWGLAERDVAIFVGARAEKRWPIGNFLELAGRILASGRRCALFAGPAERALISGLKAPAGAFLAPALPLRGFAAALAQARAFITGDTGPMHLAVALGVPTVEIFQGTEPWKFGYAHLPGHRLIDAGGREVPVDEVWRALDGLLRTL